MASTAPLPDRPWLVAAPDDDTTIARGRRWLMWWHGPTAHKIDRFCVRYLAWSPIYWLFGHRRVDGLLHGASILLHTSGRKTGVIRTSVLPAFERDGKLYLCASLGGGPRDPAWVGNLVGHPDASIHLRRRLHQVRARVLPEDERIALTPWLKQIHFSYEIYLQRAEMRGRTIPLVELTFL
jgi:deazaflavin-dependent oxidoreductase (nitroreductase family)